MPRALIIDDDELILEHIKDRLASMGHECDTALSQTEAEDLLKENLYDYFLLDLQIPVGFQTRPDKEYGKNLLLKIRSMPGHKDRPIIVITAFAETDSYRLGVDIMKHGATDFVGKPFNEKNNLEKAIREALEKYPPLDVPANGTKDNSPSKPFNGGYLDFYEDRVELCGIRICGHKGRSQARQVLDLLSEKFLKSDRRAYDQNFIADKLGFQNRGQQAVGDAVRTIRTACRDNLLKEINIRCETEDVIINRDKGYHFSDSIKVREGGVSALDRVKYSDHQLAILRELRAKDLVSRKQISNHLSLGKEQLDSELEGLLKMKVIQRVGTGAATRYQIVSKEAEV